MRYKALIGSVLVCGTAYVAYKLYPRSKPTPTLTGINPIIKSLVQIDKPGVTVSEAWLTQLSLDYESKNEQILLARLSQLAEQGYYRTAEAFKTRLYVFNKSAKK